MHFEVFGGMEPTVTNKIVKFCLLVLSADNLCKQL